MNVRNKIIIFLFLGCALLAHSAFAATVVAASDASASSKASAQIVCDGNSDQVELNNALAGGGEVILTEGTFFTSGTVFTKGGNTFRGQGPDKTVLSMAGDYAARVDIAQPDVTVSNMKITQRGWLMITTSRVKVHDVTIQDSKKTAPTVNGMFFVWADGRVCEDIEFVRCKAIDVGSTGFNLNGQRSPRVNRNIRFEDCLALRCGNAGSGKIWAVGFDFHEGADLYDLVVNNCRAEDCWESGFYFEPNFYNGEDPNTAIPVQVNSRVSNCVAVNNGWRNTEPTRFYMTGYYLSCGVTLTNCIALNSKNNGFWVWQGAKDVILNGCTDDGSDKAFQVRTGSNLRFNDCISMNARTYALYMWGSQGVVFDNFRIINPKKSSGAVSLGLREDHPNDPWPVTGCTLDILLTGADPNTLIRYYNANNNVITINGDPAPIPTVTITPLTTGPTGPPTVTPPTSIPTTIGTLPPSVGNGTVPGVIELEDYDGGGEGAGYHDTTPINEGGAYRQDGVDIEMANDEGSYAVGYTRPSEWLQYTVIVAKAGTYDVLFRAATPNSGTSFKISVDGSEKATVSVPNTGSWDAYTNVATQVTLPAGKHVIRITTNGYHNLCCMKFTEAGTTTVVPTVTPTSVPTGGTGAAIPGLIEAENYNNGGEGVAYHDTTPGNSGGAYRTDDVDIEMASSEGSYVVGWVRSGEWLKYSVNVAQAGVYDVSFRVSSQQPDGSFRMQLDGSDVCTVMVPNTGSYGSYTTVVQQVSLPAGAHTLRLYFNGYTNVNWVKFQASIPYVQTPTPTGTTPALPTTGQGLVLPVPVPVVYGHGLIPGVVEAEDFNTGGQGVAYYDTTSSNFGGAYRNEDVDIELVEGEGGPVVCWIRPGEWLKYTVNVVQTNDYAVTFRVSSPNENTQMRLQVDGATAATITVPKTGSYDSYTNVTQKVRLNGGPHIMRLVLGGYQNINYMAFVPAGSASVSMDPEPTMTANATPPAATLTPAATATVPINATPPVPTVNATAPTPTNTSTPTPSPAETTPGANATEPVPTPSGTAMPPALEGNATPEATPTPIATPTPEATLTPVASPTPLASSTPAPGPTVTETAVAPVTPGVEPTTPVSPSAPNETAAAPTPTMAPSLPVTEPTGAEETATAVPTPDANVTGTATPVVTATATPVAVTETPTPTATATEEPVPPRSLVQVASTDRNLSTFLSAVATAGLTTTLEGVGPYTVFAPTDAAFEALPPAARAELLSNRTLLAEVLGNHVAEGCLDAANITRMSTIRMLQGDPVPVMVKPDGRIAIGNATVNQTDIQAGNGILHVIDAVILPPGAIPTPTTVPVTTTAAGTTAAQATATRLATPTVPGDLKPSTTATRIAT